MIAMTEETRLIKMFRTDGKIDGRMDGWTGGRMDGWTEIQTDGRKDIIKIFLLALEAQN